MGRFYTLALTGLLLAAGCGKDDEGPTEDFDAKNGLLGDGVTWPFPNAHLVGDDGKLALSPGQFPPAPSSFPADLANFRTGFSPMQVSTLNLPGVDCSECPKWKNPTPGEGSVLMVDLTDNAFLPVMAELDAWKPNKNEDPTLLIRPQIAVPFGHDVAVVVTTAALPRQERFGKLIDGVYDSDWSTHYRDVVDQVVALGVNEDEIALAWDYPVGDGTAPTRSAVAQADPPGSWTFTISKEADLGDAVPPTIWRQAQGNYDVVDFLVDGLLDLDSATGEVAPTGTKTAAISVAIPNSVKDAPAGSVPVLIYGHGLFGSSSLEIYSPSGSYAPFEIADELGMIVIATDWGGLDSSGAVLAAAVANDLGKFPNLSSAMIQGQANHQALLRLLREGDILDDPMLQGAQGQSLIDSDHIYYWGMSMGGILGGVAMAQEGADYEAGVFHVGGSSWSTMLERSSAWTTFELWVTDAVPSPRDRQLFYSASQLFWDPVDPISYAPELSGQMILLQESKNDDTVHNMVARILARTIELPVLEPSVDSPWGLEPAQANLPPGSRAFVQFDTGALDLPNKNRPAGNNGAHTRTSGWWESWGQAADFLTPGSEGQVIHYCGAAACSSSNRGTPVE